MIQVLRSTCCVQAKLKELLALMPRDVLAAAKEQAAVAM